jgi:nucleotide-binding universal stress UspA family protein
MNRRDLEALALARLARLASIEEDPAGASELTQRATALAVESGSREALGFARAVAGGCFALADDLDAAEAAYRESLAAYEEIGAGGRAGWVQTLYATLMARRGNVAAAEKLLREAVASLPEGLPVTTVLKHGHPGEEIVAQLEAGDHDLLVMGSRGLGRVSSNLFGSVGGYVHYHAHVAMLVLHPE